MRDILNNKSTANTLALHYFDAHQIDYAALFYFCEKWMSDHGFEPDRMDGTRSHVTFSRGKKALEKGNFQRAQEDGFWMADLHIDADGLMNVLYYDAAVQIGRPYDEYRRNEFNLSWDDNLLHWDSDIFLAHVRDIYCMFQPGYGYVFQRKFAYGPILYPSGCIMGLRHPHPERDEITAWGIIGIDNHSLYKPHFIRDVYPLNFLSPQHLEGPVGGQTLRQWIESDPGRGTLAPVVGDLTAWTVDPAHIPTLREELRPHNILICFMDY